MQEIEIERFLDDEYSNSALYQCFRSIASYVDGLKPSSRKVVYTTRKLNVSKDFKVSRFASSVASETEYLHGENSLQGVIVNMTQDFIGSNNIPLLAPNGNFGTRFVPVASAARYIYAKKSDKFDEIFNKDDDPILIGQEFEGTLIEPKFFVPVIPLLLVNGSEGVGTGFAQKILPRNPDDLKRVLSNMLSGRNSRTKLIPYFQGFNGKVEEGDTPNSWLIYGTFERKNTSTILVTELPIGYNLSSYLKVLKDLEDNGTIKDFKDLCENDQFLFELKVTRAFNDQSDEELFKSLKLIKRVTENFTCIDENNVIRVFNDAFDLLEAYYKIRMEYYTKRKEFIIERTREELSYLKSIELFISEIVENRIIIAKKSKDQIIKQLEKYDKIIMKDGSYQYLLRMAIYSLSKEKIREIQEDRKSKEDFLDYLLTRNESDLWKEDLKESVSGSGKKKNSEFFSYS